MKKKKRIEATPPAIEVLIREDIPKNSVAPLARELRRIGNVRVRDWSPGPQAAAGDWTLPALVFVFVTRPLFEGFLQEIGAMGGKRRYHNDLYACAESARSAYPQPV